MERRIEDAPARDPVVSALFATVVALSVAGVALAIPAWSHLDPSDAVPLPLLPVAAIVYATLGALILRRARNPFGWILLSVGGATAVMFVTSCYAVVGLEGGRSLPAAEVVGVVSETVFVPAVMGIGFMLLLFPTGAVPSPRWRPVAVIAAAATAITTAAYVVTPREVALPSPGGVSLTYPNPLGLSFLRNTALGTISGLGVVSAVLIAAGAAALVVRYRSGNVELRQQIKWVALVAGVFLAFQCGLIAVMVTVTTDTVLGTVIGFGSAILALIGLPVAITVAILKYRLYEIDLIINRAVVYTLLAGAVTIVYVAIVVGVGALLGSHGGPVLTIAAAVAIALLFQPLRQRAQAVANRIVYGERASPYQVLSEFADSMANTLPLEEQLDRMVALLASGTGATRAEVWIRVGPELRAVAAWPAGAAMPPPLAGDGDDASAFDGATAVFPVRQGDERLGAIAVHKPPNEPLAPAEAALAEHVASQAGLVVRNVGLTAELRQTIDELRASRRRLIEAQDLERRKIERNLHDGAQQQLVALGVQLGLLERLAGAVPDADRVTAAIPRLQEMAGRCARGPARSGARDLPAAAGRPRAGGRAGRAGAQGGGPHDRGRGRDRALRPAGRGGGVLLHAGGAPERGQVRRGDGDDGAAAQRRRLALVRGAGRRARVRARRRLRLGDPGDGRPARRDRGEPRDRQRPGRRHRGPRADPAAPLADQE